MKNCKFAYENCQSPKNPAKDECLNCILANIEFEMRKLLGGLSYNLPTTLGVGIELANVVMELTQSYHGLRIWMKKYRPEMTQKDPLESLQQLLEKQANRTPVV